MIILLSVVRPVPPFVCALFTLHLLLLPPVSWSTSHTTPVCLVQEDLVSPPSRAPCLLEASLLRRTQGRIGLPLCYEVIIVEHKYFQNLKCFGQSIVSEVDQDCCCFLPVVYIGVRFQLLKFRVY